MINKNHIKYILHIKIYFFQNNQFVKKKLRILTNY